jgi:hypothetical protein
MSQECLLICELCILNVVDVHFLAEQNGVCASYRTRTVHVPCASSAGRTLEQIKTNSL